MSDSLHQEATKEEQPKNENNLFSKLKKSVEINEDHIEFLSALVRLTILVWSGAILTLAYVKLPDRFQIPEQKFDPTFIASVFTGVLATFGVQTAKRDGSGGARSNISKEDLERLIEAASRTAPSQTVRIEQAPVKFVTKDDEPPVQPFV